MVMTPRDSVFLASLLIPKGAPGIINAPREMINDTIIRKHVLLLLYWIMVVVVVVADGEFDIDFSRIVSTLYIASPPVMNFIFFFFFFLTSSSS